MITEYMHMPSVPSCSGVRIQGGISETRRKGEGCLTLTTSGHTFYYKGGYTCHRGVGFIVNKNIAGNVTNSVSDRPAQLNITINGKCHLNIILAYLPTSSYEDQEVESAYEDINNLIINSKAHYNAIMGDFNAKVGLGNPAKSYIGPYGLGSKNTRGDPLINIAESHQL